MKNTTWVFGSMLAAGCMLLSVPVAAQGNFPQGMPQGMPQGNFPQGMPQGMGRAPGFPQQAGAPGRVNPAGATNPATADKANAAAKNTVKNDKAALEAAKYQLSNHRTDLIKTTIDGYASSEDLSDPAIVRAINADIEKHMTLVPSVPLENPDLQELNKRAKDVVDQEFGVDDKKTRELLNAEAEKEIPLYKVGERSS